jgi:diaminohydroxyphosphoribosylaminopyrimidine deaminase/5-amino-6-(5-phosphoribosylamino)uracil reductase
MSFSAFDEQAMRRALELAERGLYTTDPNPRVGCVIARTAEIVGEGWHARAGEPHAEVFALQAAAERARGATAYVTLEPCNHHGRTPPCVDALLAAGIARVVYAIRDPNPRVDGSGAARLQAAGVTTEVGLLQAEAAALNQGFLKRMSLGRPFVRLKTAASLDGRVALANGESRWITSEAARADVQHWRARSSAILTGFGTAVADDPQLNVRLADVERQPLRVLLASSVRVPVSLKMFEPPGRALVIGAVGAGRDGQALRSAGIEVELVEGVAGRLSLPAVLATLAKRQVNEVLVEAGPTLSGALLDASLVDEWLLYLAPKLLGSSARPLADVPSPPRLASAQRFAIVDTARVGDDLRIRLVPSDANDPPPPRLG